MNKYEWRTDDDINNLNRNETGLKLYKFKMYFNISVSIVFGIPTVRRQERNYLIQTLVSFVKNMNQTEQDDSLIVVMIAEVMYPYNY